jgi:hypothetical protein
MLKKDERKYFLLILRNNVFAAAIDEAKGSELV